MENSEWLGRQVQLVFEPGTFCLPVWVQNRSATGGTNSDGYVSFSDYKSGELAIPLKQTHIKMFLEYDYLWKIFSAFLKIPY